MARFDTISLLFGAVIVASLCMVAIAADIKLPGPRGKAGICFQVANGIPQRNQIPIFGEYRLGRDGSNYFSGSARLAYDISVPYELKRIGRNEWIEIAYLDERITDLRQQNRTFLCEG